MNYDLYQSICQKIEQKMSEYDVPYGCTFSRFAPAKPTFPISVLREVRNVPVTYNKRQRVSSQGFKLDIYAKSVKSETKQQVCQKLSKYFDDLLSLEIGLRQISYSSFESEGTDGSIYHISIMYRSSFYENKNLIY